MAKIVFEDTPFAGYIYQGELDLKINSNHTRAVYTSSQTGDKIIITGDHLNAQAGNDDLFASGTVETIKFQRSDGEVMVSASQGHFNAEKLTNALDQDGVWSVFDSMFNGNDKIYGSANIDLLKGLNGDDLISAGKGNDTIQGGRGDDEMSGGSGSDRFIFYTQDKGHDIITDFDIEGPVVDVLELQLGIESIKKSGGADTMVHLDNGATILLEGIERADFVDYWNSLV